MEGKWSGKCLGKGCEEEGVHKVPLPRIKHQHKRTIDHPILRPRKLVQVPRDPVVRRDTNGFEQTLLPETAAAFDGCDGVDDDQCCDALDWTGDQAQCQCFGVVFVPGLDVECEEACDFSGQWLVGSRSRF